MRAHFIRNIDPMDSMNLGDVLGRKLKKFEEKIPDISSDLLVSKLKRKAFKDRMEEEKIEDFEKAKEIIQNILEGWNISQLGPSPSDEMYIREEGFKGPLWIIRGWPNKQYICYGYNQPHQSTTKVFYRNSSKNSDYDPNITWQELAIIFLEILVSNPKLPKHHEW